LRFKTRQYFSDPARTSTFSKSL